MSYKRKAEDKRRNPVAKHAHKFNRHVVEADRHRRAKRGYIKHKGRAYDAE